MFTGCGSWMDGHYHSITPHTDQGIREEQAITAVTSYSDICAALEDMVQSAVEIGILSVEEYTGERLRTHMELAIRYIKNTLPLGAYSVESISYEAGTVRGMAAVAVTITYNHNRSVLPKIRYVADIASAEPLLTAALNRCDSMLVLYVQNYTNKDFLQFVRDYAISHPGQVMEVPQITETHYPESGSKRVIELQFTYQNSRETLLSMQNYVQPVFSSAALYVSGESEETTKFDLLYSFLMGRNEYTVQTSVTPTYSLLRHGVGDSKAFASVYAAMCSRVGLDCQVISGTRNAEPWYWNIICEGGNYYHVDLLHTHDSGKYEKHTDEEMRDYVWDYSAYPACVASEETTSDGTE